MADKPKRNTVAWLALVIGIVGTLLNADTRFDFFREKAPRPEAVPQLRREAGKLPAGLPRPPLVPVVPIESLPAVQAKPEPDNVEFSNEGMREALIRAVEFFPESWVQSVAHTTAAYDGPPPTVVAVALKASGEPEQLLIAPRYNLPTPIPAPGGGKFTVLKILFVWPEAAGLYVRGQVRVHFANTETLVIKDVILHVVKSE